MPRPEPGQSPAQPLRWSPALSHRLAACERAVYWHDVVAVRHAAQASDGPSGPSMPEAAAAWARRHLTDLPGLTETVLRRAARAALEAAVQFEDPPTAECLLAGARFTLNQAWRNSRPPILARFWRWPTTLTVLRELADGGALSAADIAGARAQLAAGVRALAANSLAADVRAAAHVADHVVLPPAGLPLPFDPGVPRRPPAPVWARVDAAYRHVDLASVGAALQRAAEAQPEIAAAPPWRRGPLAAAAAASGLAALPHGPTWTVVVVVAAPAPDPEGERLALAVGGLWLDAAGYPATYGRYLGRIVDLTRGEDRWCVLTPADLDAARARVGRDLTRLEDRLREVPPGPAERQGWAVTLDRGTCPACPFQPLCAPELAASDGSVLGATLPAPGAVRVSVRAATARDVGPPSTTEAPPSAPDQVAPGG